MVQMFAPGGRAATSETTMLSSASGDLGDDDAVVAAAEPLEVTHPGLEAEHLQGARPRGLDGVEVRRVDLAGQHHHPLDPGVLHHRQRRRIVVGDGAEADLAVEDEGVEGVLLAGHELLEEHRAAAPGPRPRERLAQRDIVVGAVGVLRGGAGRWFDHQRIADLDGEARGRIVVGDEAVARDGQAPGAQRVLHARLVAEGARLLHAHPGQAELLAGLGQGLLDLLDHPEDPVQRAELRLDLPGGADDLRDAQAVAHPRVGAHHGADLGREEVERILADQAERHVGQRRGDLDEALGVLGEIGRDEDDDVHGGSGVGGRVARLLRARPYTRGSAIVAAMVERHSARDARRDALSVGA